MGWWIVLGILSVLPVHREVEQLATSRLQRLAYTKVVCSILVAQAGRSVLQWALAARLVQRPLQAPVDWSVSFHRCFGSAPRGLGLSSAKWL